MTKRKKYTSEFIARTLIVNGSNGLNVWNDLEHDRSFERLERSAAIERLEQFERSIEYKIEICIFL